MSRWLILGLVALCIAIGLPLGLRVMPGSREGGATAQPASVSSNIVARGRIEPKDGVVAVNGPPESLSTVAIVDRLMVEQGSKVVPGQVLAVLSGYDLSRADLEVSLANLHVAQAQQAQLRAGVGKKADIAAQTNVLAARRAQLVKVELDYNRASTLVEKRSASTQLLETQKAALDQITQEVAQAENVIKALSEVRPVDDAVAAAQVAVAEANVARARAATERLQVRARSPGTVLSIQTRAGEVVGAEGILRLGDIDRLVVIAEVDESQVGRLQVGMAARIEGGPLPDAKAAIVSRIGSESLRQRRPSSDILVGRDARIVEVEIAPAPDQTLPKVIGAAVTVRLASSTS